MNGNDSNGIGITATTLVQYSNTLLSLQKLAQEQALEHFHALALQQLQVLIAFDKAWWGSAALIDDLPEEHSAFVFGLPRHFISDWVSIRHEDVTVDLVHGNPGSAYCVDTTAPNAPAGLAWLGCQHGFGEFMCIVHMDAQTQLSNHLSLYRPAGAPPFSPTDRLLLQTLMPHLVAAQSANHIRTMVSRRATLSGPHTFALAVCDQRGTLHSTERSFVDLLLKEWPDWTGPILPEPASPLGYIGRHIRLESQIVHDLFLLTARPQSPLNLLSARETDVATLFGEGLTYKAIARELGLAPNTVRHHIRSIYSKLGVNDKAAIAQLTHHPSG